MENKTLTEEIKDISNQSEERRPLREEEIINAYDRLSPHLIFTIIRRAGFEELARPDKALIFSGIVAGIVITFSFVCKAILTADLPESPWSEVVTNVGYSVGFILVILGRMQLFTENTITTVIPLFNPFSWRKLAATGRLWSIVFLANLIGTAIAAWFLSSPLVSEPTLTHALMEISDHVMAMSPLENFSRGIPAGILIAALVWMLPSAGSSSFFLILFFTYFIALCGFTHVVVGSAEAAYAVINGRADLVDYFFRFLIPTGFGNILGGTGIFTLLIYVQIKEELEETEHHG